MLFKRLNIDLYNASEVYSEYKNIQKAKLIIEHVFKHKGTLPSILLCSTE